MIWLIDKDLSSPELSTPLTELDRELYFISDVCTELTLQELAELWARSRHKNGGEGLSVTDPSRLHAGILLYFSEAYYSIVESVWRDSLELLLHCFQKRTGQNPPLYSEFSSSVLSDYFFNLERFQDSYQEVFKRDVMELLMLEVLSLASQENSSNE